ncbi:MAG TPA: ABC transporter ATP-binding protein, partial [Kofleriaceae bacterium]|nr:ABC transporter ATP-binding protein [Kofleriaceae bacterium]
LSGRDNLRLLADLSGGCPPARIDAVLERVGLRDRARDPVRVYSHGMKQRLAIAAALLPGPELVLLDEPTNGLDPMGIRDVRALIRSLAHDDGLTVFLSSHLLAEVEQVCNRAGVIHLGRKIWEGEVAELLGARRRLEVVAAPADAARAVLEELAPGQVTESGGGFTVGGALDPADAVDRLVAAGCRVSKIVASTPTLEEVFVELVGGDR